MATYYDSFSIDSQFKLVNKRTLGKTAKSLTTIFTVNTKKKKFRKSLNVLFYYYSFSLF